MTFVLNTILNRFAAAEPVLETTLKSIDVGAVILKGLFHGQKKTFRANTHVRIFTVLLSGLLNAVDAFAQEKKEIDEKRGKLLLTLRIRSSSSAVMYTRSQLQAYLCNNKISFVRH